MNLFKIEDAIAEHRNYTREDIMRMPFYEFMLKLEIMKERSEEQKKQQDAEHSKQKQTQLPKYSQPKMPKLPTKYK